MVTTVADYIMRGGNHPHPVKEDYEKNIAAGAMNLFISNPEFAKKGLRWVYDYIYFKTWYVVGDQKMLDYLHDHRPYPEYLEIETTSVCNFKCKMCEHTYWPKGEPLKHMTYREFLYIMEQFPTLRYMGLTGIGQSYLNPDYPKMIDYVKSKGIFLEIFDTFQPIDDGRAEHLVRAGVDKMYVSCDAATKETYDKIRVGSDWDTAMENIKNLDRWKKKLNTSFPELCFHFIVSKINIHELEKYLEMIHELDVDVGYVQYTKLLHEFKEIKDDCIDIPDAVKQKVIDKGKSLGIRVAWNMNSADCLQDMPMCSVWTMPFIFVDGTVVPCCSQNEQNDRDWQRKVSLGNIFKDDFSKIWHGKKYRGMIKGIKENTCPAPCSRCILYNMKGDKK